MAQRTIYKNKIEFTRLVLDDNQGGGEVIWIADDLDEVEVSITRQELQNMLPTMMRWAEVEYTTEIRDSLRCVSDALDELYKKDRHNTIVHEAFNRIAEILGFDRRLPDEPYYDED